MKKSVVKLFRNFLFLCSSILSGLAFYSCGEDAGLGGAIDTKAPTLSIDYPKESGSAIRDSFILAGTVSDDKSISRVAVNVKSLDDGGKFSKTYSASFDPVKNRWWVDINKYEKIDDNHGSWQYPDGNYEFSVTAFDNAGNNSGTYSKTFEIDNTPPVFIISNPGVIKKTNLSPSAYGSLFTIDGTISDNHTISFMDVKIYNANGKCVSSETYEGENLPYYREEDIATAGGTSVQIAQYANASEENRSALNTRYTQLHESDSGTEYYYAEIKLTDSTKVYQDPWGEDARSADEISADQLGNSTSTVYLYDDVYASLMSAKKGLGLSAANLKDIISGVYTGSANKDEVLKVLDDKAYDTSLVEDDPMANKLSFSLNPEANPTYNVNGFEFGFGDDAVQSASTGNTVSVTISAGLDGTNIAPEIVRVWMKEYKDRPTDAESIKADLRALEKQVETLEKSETEFLDALHKSETAAATTVKTGDSDWVLIYDYSLNNSKGSSVSTKTFSVTLPEGIKLSKYYILGVTGYDIEDVEFAQNSVYGFEGNTAGVPPTLKVETPANLSIWGDFEKPQFSGTATISSKSLYLTELTATLTIQDETTNATEGEFTDTITCKIENDKQTWELSEAGALTWDSVNEKWNLDTTKLPGLVELYNENAKTADGVYWLATLKISGKSSSGHEGESSQSIHIDTVAPKVSLASVTPSVSGSDYFGGTDTNTYLNGTVTVKGNIDEQNMADSDDAVSYDILAATGDDEPVSILAELIAHAEELGVAFDGKLGKAVTINQSFNTRLISEFFHSFKGAAEDEKIKIEVKVTVKDKAGNLGTCSSNDLNDGKYFIIYQETDRPKIELGNADASITTAAGVKLNHNLFGTTSNNKLTISFSDDDSIAEYEVSVYDKDGKKLDVANVSAQGEDTEKANPYIFYPKKTTASLSYILPSKEAKYQIEIKAHDEFYLPATSLSSPNPYGEKIIEKFFVAVDSGAPEVEISTPAVNSFQSGSVQIEGSVSKAVDLEGTLTKTGSTKPEDTKKFSLKSSQMKKDGKSYNWTLPADVAEDGEYTINVTVKDIYNQTAKKPRTFKVDTKSPEIKSATTSVDSANGLVPLDEMEYITLRTDVTDGADPKSVAGVSVVKYFLTKDKFTAAQLNKDNISTIKTAFDGTDWTQMNQGSTVEATNVTSFNASVPVKTFATNENDYEGKAYLYVATEDNVGNFAIKAEPVELNLDKSAPEIKIALHDKDVNKKENQIANSDEIRTKVLPYTFDAYLSDTNVPSKFDEAFNVSTVTSGSLTADSTFENGKAVFSVDGITDETSATITLQGTDENGRKSAERKFVVSYDKTPPKVVLYQYENFSSSSSVELKGTITDPNFSTTSADALKLYLVPVKSGESFKKGNVTYTKDESGSGYIFTANFTGLKDIEYNVAIVATDTFENESKYSTDAAKTVEQTGANTSVVSSEIFYGTISIDALAPTSTVTLKTDNIVLAKTKSEVTDSNPHQLKFGDTYYTKGQYIIGGEITETNLVLVASDRVADTELPTLTVSKDSAAKENLNFTITSNGDKEHYTWSYTLPANSADGVYEYTLTLWDKSKQQFSKTVTIVLDTKEPELSITSPSAGESFESSPIAKIAYSDDGVGIDTTTSSEAFTYIVKNITDSENPVVVDSANYEIGNGSATGTLTFKNTFNTEGTFSFSAKVKDYLGHEKVSEERTFYFDKSKPTVTETSVGNSGLSTNGLVKNGGTGTGFKLVGTIYDSNGLYNGGATKTVTENGVSKTLAPITISATVGSTEKTWPLSVAITDKKSGTWSIEFVVGSNNSSAENYLPDGTYNFTIVATDVANKTNQISRTVTVDTVAPKFGTGTENTEDAGYDATNVKPHVSTNSVNSGSEVWYKSNELRFTGTATDKIDGVEGTGIKEVYFETSADGTNWSNKDYLAGTASWAGTVQNLVSKTTIVHIVVVDNAGNESTPVVLGPFNIDTIAPISTIGLNPDDGGKLLDSAKQSVTGIEFEKVYYTNKTFTLVGNITEQNIDSANPPSLKVAKNGATAETVEFTTGGTSAGEWTYELPSNTDDGEYVFIITVKDKVGYVFEKSVTITLDDKKPTISITSPGDGESFINSPILKIAYSDDGVGINTTTNSDAFTYTILNITDPENETPVPAGSYGISNGTATGTITFDNNFNTEGTFKLTAKVKDYLGHDSDDTVDSVRTFYFDKEKPSVTETNVGDSGLTTNGLVKNGGTGTGFKLIGTIYDSNGLYNGGAMKTVTENGVPKTLAPITISATVGGVEKTWPLSVTTTDKKNGTWSIDFVVGSDNSSADNYLPDGTYTFTIVATDVANKTNQISRTVTVDTVAPQFGTKDVNEGDATNVKPHVSTEFGTKTVGTSVENWYKTDTLRFEGTASDGEGTGIKEIYYLTGNVTETGSHTWSTTKKTFAGTTSWAGTIEKLLSKSSVIKVVAVDNAGNEKETDVFGPYNIDMTAPELASAPVKVNDQPASEESPFYSSGIKGSIAATVTFNVNDETNGSEIQKVDVQIYNKATDSTTAIHANLATDGSGSCSAIIPASSISKSGTVYARIYDYAGNYSDVNLFALTYDATNPVIQSATLKDSSDYTAYKPNQDVEKYYVNNTDGNFTLSGIATDNLGLKSAKLELKEGSDVKKTYEITDETKLSDWKFEIGSDLSTLSLTATETSPLTAALTVTDKAGNKATKDIAIVFDTTKPAALHNFDSGSTPKDAVFRIGEDDNDPAEIGAALTAKDKDVGGKYAPGTYGKANTITVRGYFTEEGSGLQYVYYKVFSQSTAPTADQINTFVSDYKTEKTGYFSAIAEDTKRVKFNTSTTAYEFGDIKTNFKSTISEFGIGKNYLVLVGVDYVGNAQADSIYYSDGTTPAESYYSINVDVEAPTVERVLADGESSTLLTNASSADLVLKGTAFDNPSADSYANASGIKSLSASIKVKEKTGTEKEYKTTDSEPQISIVPSDNNTKWSVTVKKEIFANVDAGNFSVYVTATDNAGTGNSQTSNVGTITVDKIKPTVTLALPADADTSTAAREINGIIDLSGTVKDANPLPETSIVAIQYIKKADYTESDDSESAGTKWVTLTNTAKGGMTNLELSGDYTFDIKNFDTTKIEPLNDVVYYIRAKAVDKAGNVGYSPIKDSKGNFIEITISQDSDRPVVKIVNLTEVTGAYPYILKYGTKSQVIATVTDDDGIDKVYVSESAYTGTGTAPTTSAYVPTTGTLTFTPQADTTANSNVDGEKKFYVYVKDTAGKEFYTTYYADATAASTAKYLNVPKVKVNDTSLTDTANAAQFVYFSDSTSPEVGVINALSYKEGTNATTAGVVNGGLNNTTGKYTEYEGVNASYVIGGTERQWVQFQISANDASGISGIYMEVSYKDKSNVQQTIKRRTSAAVGTEGIVSADDTFEPAKEADGTTDSRTTKIWTTDKISFANAKGNISLKIIPYDASGLQGNGQVTFVADTTGPEIKITSPEPTDEVTGTVSVVGIATDQGGSKTASTKWLIPTRTERKITTDDALYQATKDKWLDTGFTVKSTASSWTFELKQSEISVYDTDGSDKSSGTDTGYAQSVADGVFILPFYVLSTDELGNRTIKRDYTIKHNPDADRPKTTISYPDQSGRTLGGTIRVTGESIIPAGEATVKAVYLQIGTVTNGVASFGDAAKTKASGSVNMVSGVNNGGYGYTVKTPAQVKTDNGFASDLNFGSAGTSEGWWGIPVTKTSSAWNFSLNANGELDPVSGNTNHIAIRACAVNSDGKVGAWSATYFVDVDSTAPTQIATLRQFAASGTNAFSTADVDSNLPATQAAAIRSYEAEMYLKGDWYLTVQLEDESLLDSYSVKKGSQTLTSGCYASSKKWTFSKDGSDDQILTGDTVSAPEGFTVKHVSRTLFIPVDKTEEKVDYTVSVTDSNETGGHTINAVYSLRIDNTAPTITKIYKGSDSENSPALTENYTVNDENYIFTLGGKVTENGSGLERVVFYYVRENDDSKTYNRQAVLDPLVKSATGTADSKAYLYNESSTTAGTDDTTSAILTKRTFSQDLTHSYGLWALAVPGKMKADGYTFEASSSLSLADNKHIRTGGLIEVGGILRRIESISGTTVTFDSNTGVTADTATTAYFPYAQVVDNTNTEKTESTSANPFRFQSGDDGDAMPETVSGSKSTGYLWDSSVHTTNIPDGPAKLVVLVFDKAGNVSGATYTVKVENSAPRLAKVFLGTDLNSNNEWQANEFVGYDLYNANETYGIGTTEVKASQTIQTASYGSSFIIKDKLAVVAEFVGGNGDIIMVYGKDATGATPVPSTGTGSGISAAANETITSLITATDKIGSVTYNKKTVTTSLKGFTLTSKQVVGLTAEDATIAETNDGTGKKASFTFWDSTEELVQGSTSQNCVLYVTDFAIDLHDGLAPTTVINPFYWQSLNSNSIYGSSDENNVSSVGDLQGHIELESDWTATDSTGKLTSWDGKGIADGTALDADPKVSGKITFTGTAYDEHALSKLTASFSDVLSSVYIATYDKGNSKWTVAEATIGTDGYEVTVTDAGKTYSYDGSQKTTTSTESAYGVFKDTAYFGQKGHKVYWTLSIDTEKLSTKVGADISLNVIAKDLSNNTTAPTEELPTISEGYIPGQELSTSVTYTVIDGTTNKPSYTVDVVPYITEVKTSLSSLKSGNPSVYTRTALGHYTVRSDEQVDFVGFNLGDGASLSIATRDTSGRYDFELSGIKALNNLNTNNSRGAYKSAISDSSSYNVKNNYAYNRLPNNDNNNLLTDDIWFDIWQFNNRAAVPITGKIEQPVMKIRPTDGKIGFAFVNGPLYFSMGGSQSSQDYSYQYWAGSYDLWSSIGFTYDSFGNSYGVGAGGDSNSGEGDAFILASSKFGIGAGGERGSYDGANTLRLERIGQYNDGAFDIDKQKIKSPSIVSSQNGTDKTNLYLAYYDGMNDEIRFKSGTTNNGNVRRETTTSWIRKIYELDGGGYTGAWVYERENGNNLGCADGDFVYFCDENGNVLDNTPYVIKGLFKNEGTSWAAPANGNKEWAFQITNGNGNSLTPFTSPLGKTSADYNNYTQGHRDGFKNISDDNVYIKIVKTENTGVTKNFGQFQDSANTSNPGYSNANVSILANNTTTYKTGAYVSLGVVPSSVTGGNDTVVAVWLDQANPALPILRYAYNSDPINNPGSWTYVDRVFPASSNYSYSGEYCKVAVDQNGGVHIAAYDQKNLDLIYAYLPADKKGVASSASDFKSCIVDSNGVVGSNLNIDVGINGEGKIVPYISYYATSIIRPKLAYYVGGFSATETIEAGAAKDLHTGKWECANVPTESNVEMQSLQHNDINVGLWKDAGVIVDSTSDKYTTGTSSTTNQPNAYNSVSNGQIYGNGTANPVLGYAIKINSKSGAIETAQMK